MTAPTVGDRDRPGGGSLDLEWTGDAWTPVCPADDVPMDTRDGDGWLCCQVCHVRAVDLAGGVR